jgi:signal transduction histidine kinase
MTRRLLVSFVSITVFGLALFGIPLGLSFANRERDRLLFDIERDADTMAASVNGQPAEWPRDAISAYAQRTGGRVVVVDSTGRSLFDTDAPNGPSSDFASRPEIQEALRGNRVDGTRHSNTVGGDLLFVAVPTNDDGRVNGAVRITYPTATLDERVRRAWTRLAMLGIVVVAVVAGVAFLVARSLSRPVRRLEDATEGLASGALQVRVDESLGPRELRHLGATFNRMADRMMNVLNAEKRFVADASHQLRTPLTALRLRLENLETSATDAERPAIDAAVSEVVRMSRLVDGLLTLERGDAETVRPVAVDVAAIARDRAEVWRELTDEHHVIVEVVAPDDEVWAQALPGAVEQIVDNLVDNALAVSPAGGTVTLQIERTASNVELHVIDEGPGLDADARRRAFDRFWRGTDRTSGSGLGLAIVRRLTEVSGGAARLDAAPSGGIDAVILLMPGDPAVARVDTTVWPRANPARTGR